MKSFKTIPALVIFLLLSSFSLTAQTVYKTPSGHKYHTAQCRSVKNVSEKLSLDGALKLGLSPCKICNPVSVALLAASKPVQGEAKITVQCKGMTKAGNRCRHRTSIGNGYCYQHQPN